MAMRKSNPFGRICDLVQDARRHRGRSFLRVRDFWMAVFHTPYFPVFCFLDAALAPYLLSTFSSCLASSASLIVLHNMYVTGCTYWLHRASPTQRSKLKQSRPTGLHTGLHTPYSVGS